MNFTELTEALNSASPFDLYRLKSAIGIMLDDPVKLQQIKRQLIVGDEVEYFCPDKNGLVKATIVQVKRTLVGVLDVDGGRGWNLPFYMINLNNVDVAIEENRNIGLTKNQLSIGETVGFIDDKRQEVFGTVLRLNPKTVTVNTDKCEWRIPYVLLFKVLDGESSESQGTLLLD
ncbi:MAG: hypothetical protein HRU24_18720 [Gammaproteobacteria bacterium]|nr:hypothetical protein [Gammaproteobacteria bacterium]